MEANYAHQQELDMIPLMMQKDYSPKGWLGMILGTRMWYAVYSTVYPLLSETVFLLRCSLLDIISFLYSHAGMRCGVPRRTMMWHSIVGWTASSVRLAIEESC
jgi:hypothetical protein